MYSIINILVTKNVEAPMGRFREFDDLRSLYEYDEYIVRIDSFDSIDVLTDSGRMQELIECLVLNDEVFGIYIFRNLRVSSIDVESGDLMGNFPRYKYMLDCGGVIRIR